MPLIQLRRLCKSFGGVRALEDVSLEIAPGEIRALCGENGAGKSTLIKALTGVVAPDAGEILVDGNMLAPGDVQASEAAGIAAVHQESTVFPDLNTIENIFVGRELTRCRGLLLDWPAMRRQTLAALDRLGESFDIDVPVGRLTLAQRQTVAMARALARDCRLLILDEPTASLSSHETRVLLTILSQVRDQGVSVLYVSHRLEEVFEVADRVSVLRDGRFVETNATAEINAARLIELMVGRELDELNQRHEHAAPVGDVVLDVNALSRRDAFHDVSFSVRAGEILGIAGLVGAGRSEVVRALFGIDGYDRGTVAVEGEPLPKRSVQTAIARGLALVPEDRQHEGLVLEMSVGNNLSLAMLGTLSRMGLIERRRETDIVAQQLQALRVKTAGPSVPARTLSGGNQQKLVLGKWLAGNPRVLILDEPTRGVDVGAKAQVHRLIRRLASDGVAILMISSELPEVLSVSDRILVMREGRIAGELSGKSATQAEILELALPDAVVF